MTHYIKQMCRITLNIILNIKGYTMLYKRVYFRNEEELAKVRMFIRKMRLAEDARNVGIELNALEEDSGHDGRDFSNTKQDATSAENKKDAPLPYSCKKMIGMGYAQDVVVKAYEVYKDMINNAGEGVVVETSLEDIIKGMLNG